MIKKNQELINRLNMLSDGLLVFISFTAAFFLRSYCCKGGAQELRPNSYEYMAVGLSALQMIFYGMTGVYQAQRKRRLRILCCILLLDNFLGITVLQTVLFMLRIDIFSREMLLALFSLETLCVCVKHIAVRLFLRKIRKDGFNQKLIVLIGSGDTARNCQEELNRCPELGSQIIGYLSKYQRLPSLAWLGKPEELAEILERVKPDEVIAALEADEQIDINLLLYACDIAGVRLSLIPGFAVRRASGPQIDMINDIPLLVMRRIPLDYFLNAAVKRFGDFVCAAVLLLGLSPLLCALAIGIKISSPGPILFRQTRIGYRKKPFVMYKFRSMRRNDREDDGWTIRNDPRRTRFGAFLRKWSLDELPQLLNVLKGDMSLVGPRPELPFYVEKFREDIPGYMIKHLVRPGMTGLAQVRGLRGDTSIEKRIEADLYYIENWSPWLDTKILLRTIWHIKSDELISC